MKNDPTGATGEAMPADARAFIIAELRKVDASLEGLTAFVASPPMDDARRSEEPKPAEQPSSPGAEDDPGQWEDTIQLAHDLKALLSVCHMAAASILEADEDSPARSQDLSRCLFSAMGLAEQVSSEVDTMARLLREARRAETVQKEAEPNPLAGRLHGLGRLFEAMISLALDAPTDREAWKEITPILVAEARHHLRMRQSRMASEPSR